MNVNTGVTFKTYAFRETRGFNSQTVIASDVMDTLREKQILCIHLRKSFETYMVDILLIRHQFAM